MCSQFPSMLDKFSFTGSWNCSVFVDNKAYGSLEYSPTQGFLIKAQGYIRPEYASIFAFSSYPPLDISGFLDGRYYAEFNDCRISSSHISHEGKLHLACQEFRSYRPATFTSIRRLRESDDWREGFFSFDILDRWFQTRPFIQHPQLANVEDTGRIHTIAYDGSYKCFEDIDCGEYEISNSYSGSFTAAETMQSISYQPWLSVKYKEPCRIQRFTEMASYLRILLSVLAGKRALNSQIVLYPERVEGDPFVRERHTQIVLPTFEDNPQHESYAMPFDSRSLGDSLPIVFCKSIKVIKELSLFFDLFLASHISDDSYLSYKFLTLVQALEGYHRLRMDSPRLPESEYVKYKELLAKYYAEELPNELRNSFVRALDYGNEQSLRKRLHCLLDLIGDDNSSLIIPKKSDFIERVVDWRNTISHAKPNLTKEDIQLRSISDDYHRLHLLFASLLWMELGIPKNQIRAAWERGYRWIIRSLTNEQTAGAD